MKSILYRKKRMIDFDQLNQDTSKLEAVMDDKLFYLNHSFGNNLKLQEIYKELISNKMKLHASTIKQYYSIFTQNQTDSIMFTNYSYQREDTLKTLRDKRQVAFNLKRLYARFIEKAVVKISYYLVNKVNLAFMYTSVKGLIKKTQHVMRRFDELNDLTNIDAVISKIYQENQLIQEEIINELVNKGYISSSDQFYRINGIDLEHKQYYQRKPKDICPHHQEDSKCQPSCHSETLPSTQPDAIKHIQKQSQLQEQSIEEIESKFKNILTELDHLMRAQIPDKMVQISKGDRSSYEKGRFNAPKYRYQEKQFDKKQSNANTLLSKNIISKDSRGHNRQKIQKTLKQESQINSRSEIHCKTFTIHQMVSDHHISDHLTKITREKTSREKSSAKTFFTKSFVKVLRTIERQHLGSNGKTFPVKRMSQQFVEFHRKSKDLGQYNTLNFRKLLKLNREDSKWNQRSHVMKLLNIYKNNNVDKFVNAFSTALINLEMPFNQSTLERISAQKSSNVLNYSTITPSLEYFNPNQTNQSNQPLKNTDRQSSCQKSQFKNSVLQHHFYDFLKKKPTIKDNPLRNVHNQLKKTIRRKQPRATQHRQTKTVAILKNIRLSHKILPFSIAKHLPERYCNKQMANYNSGGATNFDEKSIMTPKGIERSHNGHQRTHKRNYLNKSMPVSPEATPVFPHFQVYDRIRRVVIR